MKSIPQQLNMNVVRMPVKQWQLQWNRWQCYGKNTELSTGLYPYGHPYMYHLHSFAFICLYYWYVHLLYIIDKIIEDSITSHMIALRCNVTRTSTSLPYGARTPLAPVITGGALLSNVRSRKKKRGPWMRRLGTSMEYPPLWMMNQWIWG